MKNEVTIKQKICFAFIAFLLFVLSIEILWRVLYYQTHANHPLALVNLYQYCYFRLSNVKSHCKEIRVNSSGVEQDYIKSNNAVGWSLIPGKYIITAERNFLFFTKRTNIHETIGEDGFKITSKTPEKYKGKPEIWILGCSYTYGHLLNDEETFPWLVQQELNDYYVRNLGVPGYGNLQELLQFQELLKNGQKPKIAIFMYNKFHLERNAQLKHIGKTEKEIKYPTIIANENGNFDVKFVSSKDQVKQEFDNSYLEKITMVIFEKIKQLCDRSGIIPVISLQDPSENDPIIRYAKNIGYFFIDISFPLTPEYQFLPFDGHPNSKANKIFAKKLIPQLKAIIEKSEL